MAARENQGYLIAVIVLVLLTMLLALMFFLTYMRANDLADAASAAETKATREKAVQDAYRIQADVLMGLLGGLGKSVAEVETSRQELDNVINKVKDADRPVVADIKKKVDDIALEHEKDMKLFLGPKDQNREETWRGLVKNFGDALSRKYDDLVVSMNEQARIDREAKAAIAAKEQEVEQTKKLLELSQQDLSKKTEEYETYKTQQDQKFEEFQTKYLKLEQDAGKERATLTDVISKRDKELELKVAENTELKKKVDLFQKEEFDIADGEVVRVGNNGSVFLNRGAKDGLKTTRTFSVFNSTDTNFDKNNPKAALEVIKVWDHQAEARVTYDNPLKPILAGDKVINPVWDPGYSVPIALAGVFDIDRDGIDDSERLIQMIKQNGGNVVAAHDAEGNVVGELNSATRYMVVGDSPVVGKTENAEKISRSMRTLLDQSKQFQIQEIDVRKLLNWMGKHSLPVVERLDSEVGNQFRLQGTENDR
jgi:hypothetical protein